MESATMTPSILKNVVRMPKQRARQVRTRISYMTADQLDRFLKDINFGNEQVHIARLKGSLDSTQSLLRVKGNSLFDERTALKAWLTVRKPDADNYVFN